MALSYKKVGYDDWKLLFDWRNDPETVSNSIFDKNISLEDHLDYINTLLSDEIRSQYIFRINDEAVGTIRCDQIGPEDYNLSYTINPEFRKHGLGKIMVYNFLLEKKGNFFAEVKSNNIASIKICEWNGFELIEKKDNLLKYLKRI